MYIFPTMNIKASYFWPKNAKKIFLCVYCAIIWGPSDYSGRPIQSRVNTPVFPDTPLYQDTRLLHCGKWSHRSMGPYAKSLKWQLSRCFVLVWASLSMIWRSPNPVEQILSTWGFVMILSVTMLSLQHFNALPANQTNPALSASKNSFYFSYENQL